ncbi:hypothetical protein GCM10023200_12750 [Actinomycetospora chlora]|uniref:DUF6777 domain-containing protein n=1 Tax=Actinomycetospora chlora TaxID=663608 RepID=A0ABP9AJQ5_9PSEU
MIVPPPPVVVQVQPPPRRRARAAIVVLVVLAVLVAAAAGMLVAREMSAPTTVALEPVATAGADPFMPAVGTDAVAVRPVAHTGGRRSGTTPGLYGGSGSDAVCDRGQLSRFLADHPDRAAGWASVLGLGDSSATTVSRYVDGLTSVVLRSDTYVTNHGWAGGHVTSWPAVLQAGTAVLVDDHGNPVTRCFCGNPLSAPRSFSSVAYYGPRWVSFTSTAITVITHQTTTVTNNYTIVDVHTGRGWDRPAGSDGHHDTVNVDVTINNNYFPPAQPSSSTDPAEAGAADGTPINEATNAESNADPNAVDPNAVDPNAVDPNAVDPSAVDPNAVDPNAVDPNGGDPETSDTSDNARQAPARSPAAGGGGTTPESEDAATEGTPEGSGTVTPSDTSTTTAQPAVSAPSGTYSASGCFGGGSVMLSDGSVTVDGATVGSYTFAGSSLQVVPNDGSAATLSYSDGTWSGNGCALSEASR